MSPRPTTRLEQQQRHKSLALRTIRVGSLVLMLTVALLLILQQPGQSNFGQASVGLAINYWVPILIAVVFFALVLAVDIFTPNKKIAAISGVFLGGLTGILATIALGFIIDLVLQTWIPHGAELDALRPVVRTTKVMLGIALCYLCISTVLQTQDQFRLVIPYVEFSKQLRGVRPTVIDTSVLVDGRILDVAATGILQSPLVIPGFVIAELQTLADSGDKLKRTRGRRGLDVLTRLQRQGGLDLSIDDTPVQALAVDQAIVELAELLGARVMTADLGLARTAQIRNVWVFNIHEIATAFRPALVPGEQISVKLIKPGEQAGQGVGYLDDGTMVVAEGGLDYVGGPDVALLVTSTMQTAAGRLIFARVASRTGAPANGGDASEPEHTAADGSSANGSDDASGQGPAQPAPSPEGEGNMARSEPGPRSTGPKPPRRPGPPNPARNPRR